MTDLRPEQLRGLLVLLVLLPLLPAVVLLRVMMGTLQNERQAARDRVAAMHVQTLEAARTGLNARVEALAAGDSSQVAEGVYRFLRDVFGRDVRIRVTGTRDGAQAGDEGGDRRAAASIILGDGHRSWRVELFPPEEAEEAAETRSFAWTAGGTLTVTLVISGLAAVALNRRFRLHELESNALATVSHELRTPLSSMRVLLDTLLQRRNPDAKSLREYLELMAAENQKLVSTTENFLQAARLEAGGQARGQELLAAGDLVGAAVSQIRTAVIPREPSIAVSIQDPEPRVRGDREGLVICLTNLLDNAFKHSGESDGIEVTARREGAKCCLAVLDRGPGIPPLERRRIFRRFYQIDRRLSRAHPGCGLGLSIVAETIRLHGGRVEVSDRPGGGSIFRICLPAAED